MPESTNAASTGGFWIRRETSPDRVVIRSRRVPNPDNKENVPPSGHVGSSASFRRRQRRKRSPLPSWYPRTPLRDITAICRAIERRRLQEQAAMAAAAARETRGTEPSAEDATDPTAVDEPTTPAQNIPSIADLSSSSVEHPLPTPSTTTSTITDVDAEANEKVTEEKIMEEKIMEEKLTKSIEKIEEIVKKVNNVNTNKTLKEKRVMQRKTLMSMR